MKVPLLDLKPQYRALKAELDEAMLQVAASQMFILGPAVRELEEKLAAYSGAKHGIGLSSGTDALLITLIAYDIGVGDEVVTSAYSFFATGGTIARITRGDDVFLLQENESTFIPVGTVHRIENPGAEPLQIIEVQSGGYLGEDDIVRLDDNYGRKGRTD